MSLLKIMTDREVPFRSSREELRRLRSPSPFWRRRQHDASCIHRSRLRNSSRLLSSSEASGGDLDNGAAVDEEFVEPLPSNKLQKIKTRIPTRRRWMCGRLRCHPDQVPEEDAQLLRSQSPNMLRHARSSSYESTWSRHECTDPNRQSAACDKSQSLGIVEYSRKKHRRFRSLVNVTAFSDLTLPFAANEHEERSDARLCLADARQKRILAETSLFPRAIQCGWISTSRFRKGKLRKSTLSVQGSQQDYAYSVRRNSHKASASQPRKCLELRHDYPECFHDRKDTKSQLSVPDLFDNNHRQLTSDVVRSSKPKYCTGTSRSVSPVWSESLEFKMKNAMEAFTISSSGLRRTLPSWLELDSDTKFSASSAGGMVHLSGSGSRPARNSDEDIALPTLSSIRGVTSTEGAHTNSITSETVLHDLERTFEQSPTP